MNDHPYHLNGPLNDYRNQELESLIRKETTDFGPHPFVTNINEETMNNNFFRKTLWTGKHLQLTLMSLNVGEDIGLEQHPDVDQFLRIEEGQGMIKMGMDANNLNAKRIVTDDDAIFIPAGTWHNLVNIGNVPLKLYSIYAPPQHPHGTIHQTKEDALKAESHHHMRTMDYYQPYPNQW